MASKVIARYRSARSAVVLSVFGNLFLGLFKLVGGIFGDSLAVIADSIDTISDVFISAIVWIGLRIGISPRDKHHQFGHGDAEPIAGLVISMLLVIVGLEFARFTLDKIIARTVYTPGTIALVAMAVSAVVKYWMFRFTIKAAKETNSTAMAANAYNYKGDFYRSVAILAGIYVADFIPFADPVIGFAVSLWIIRTGALQGKSNILSVMGTIPSDETVKEIRDIAKSVRGVRGIHELKIHYIGVYAFANLHIKVDPDMTTRRAHGIASEVEKRIKERIWSISSVSTHIEP